MSTCKPPTQAVWRPPHIKSLVEIWADESIQKRLSQTMKTGPIHGDIAACMNQMFAESEIVWTTKQINTKLIFFLFVSPIASLPVWRVFASGASGCGRSRVVYERSGGFWMRIRSALGMRIRPIRIVSEPGS